MNFFPPRETRFLAATLALLALGGPAPLHAHAPPETPVRTFFEDDGTVAIRVEIELRSFVEDPDQTQYTYLKDLLQMTEPERSELRRKGQAFIDDAVEFFWIPEDSFRPVFDFGFTTRNNAPLTQAYDPVVLTGIWSGRIPPDAEGYRIRATDSARFEVYFLNFYEGEPLERFQVLFPGEESFVLALDELDSAAKSEMERGNLPAARDRTAWFTLRSFVRMGFVHVIPHGPLHGLFILAFALLTRRFRPLLMQFAGFTGGLVLTLLLASQDLIRLGPAIVEPLLVLGIVLLTANNVLQPSWSPKRVFLVFCFGLVHGLALAGDLGHLQVASTPPALSFLGFAVGVAGAQLALLAALLVLASWARSPERYRRWMVFPGSIVLAAGGVGWGLFQWLLV